jgi:hypothetical protein
MKIEHEWQIALPVLAMFALIGFIALLFRVGTGKW